MKQTLMLRILPVFLLVLSLFVFFGYSPLAVSSKPHSPIIVIDAGHGGFDPGKISADGIEEKEINLAIASYLKDYLIAEDYTVYMTRETDCDLADSDASHKKRSDLDNRLQLIDEKNADLMISIHQNSFPSTSEHGAQTFYYTGNENGKALALSIQTSLLSWDPSNKRQAKSADSYYILKQLSVPAVIVECGFLSNPEEAHKLADSNYQKQLAFQICVGICHYLH